MIAAVRHERAPDHNGIWVVVVNWRQADATLACLASLERAGVDSRSVVVVDNGSGDDFAARLESRYPDAIQLPQSTNLGFAKAVNIGARYAVAHGATAVLLLNNDAVVMPDAIREFAPDHILIGLRSVDQAGWQERGLLDSVIANFHLPTTVFEINSDE